MTLSPTMTVRELAIALPEATRVFEKLKIDYCCGGDQLLAEACANVGLELESLEQMLNHASNRSHSDMEIDFQNTDIVELINHILERHHGYTKEELSRLSTLIAKVVGVHGQNHPELQQIGLLFRRLSSDLALHMHKEEEILFPYLIEMEKAVLNEEPMPPSCFGTVNNPIRMMMMEHDLDGELLRAIRQQSSDYTIPADACISYQTLYRDMEVFERDLHQHIHLENNILFPRAVEMEARAYASEHR